MFRSSSFAGLAILAAALLVGTGTSQEKKDKDIAKVKGQLPSGWKKLNLSKDQIAKIYDIQGKYKGKIKGLQEQISILQSEEKTELIQILSEDQRELLRKITLGEDKKGKAPDKDK